MQKIVCYRRPTEIGVSLLDQHLYYTQTGTTKGGRPSNLIILDYTIYNEKTYAIDSKS